MSTHTIIAHLYCTTLKKINDIHEDIISDSNMLPAASSGQPYSTGTFKCLVPVSINHLEPLQAADVVRGIALCIGRTL